ncbi:leucyl/phenylalanyl-tRNA--protein transferase [Pontiellaceae bacterium B12219]|nr:leucyl/phenylalanyl-tRNA--protein transferase [Pontiellaceae bacterium B12219]
MNTPHLGVLARSSKMTPEYLQLAFSKGIVPMHQNGKVNWCWCNPRMVLYLEQMRIGRTNRRLLRSGRFTVTFDTEFDEVTRICSERDNTWLAPERRKVASELHRRGIAHSVEVWNQSGELVGGCFGTDLGGVFFSESTFHTESNAGKISFIYLNCHLQHWGYLANDTGLAVSYCEPLGYANIPHSEYLQLLRKGKEIPQKTGKWSVDSKLDVINWNPAEPGSQVIPSA